MDIQHTNLGYHIQKQEVLNMRIEDDRLENKLCEEHGINLITIEYTAQTEDEIRNVIKENLI